MRRTVLMLMSLVAYACGGGNDVNTFNASLSSANEPTGNFPGGVRPASNPTGTAAVQIVGDTVTYSLRASALSGAATNAHIHMKSPTDPASNGPVIVQFKFAPAAGGAANSVTVDDTAPAAHNPDGSPMTTAELLQHIRNGECYVNIHTTRSAAGEIRGDLK
jgi:hypothetical protein